MERTYLTTEELAERIKYQPRTIRNELKDSVLIEGKHYIRPFGGRKLLFIWEAVREELTRHSEEQLQPIPMRRGGVCRG